MTGAAILPEIKISMKSYLYLFIVLAIAIALYFLIKKIRKMRKAGKTEEKEAEKGKAELGLQKGERAFMLFFRFDKFQPDISSRLACCNSFNGGIHP